MIEGRLPGGWMCGRLAYKKETKVLEGATIGVGTASVIGGTIGLLVVGATGGILAMMLVSLIHFESVWYALLPPLAYVFCAMIEGNLATPIFLGRWLTLNPIAIILTFLIWSYLWGVVGTLLAVPILATFKIFCDRIEPLKRLGSFLGRP